MSLLKQFLKLSFNLSRVDSVEKAEDVWRLRRCLDEHDEAAVERRPREVVRVKPLPLAEAFEGIATQSMMDRLGFGLPESSKCQQTTTYCSQLQLLQGKVSKH